MSDSYRKEKRKAMVISISEYDVFPQLPLCSNNGNKMYHLLKTIGYEINDTHKIIGRGERAQIVYAISDFFETATPSDILFFYFSGHALRDASGKGYLASSDSDTKMPQAYGAELDFLNSSIEHSTSKRILTVLDCVAMGIVSQGVK